MTDPSGGAVVAAKVAITDLATGVVCTTTSNSAGSYAAPNLLPGKYEIRVTAQGFSVATVKDIILTVGAQQEINVVLSVGNVSEKVQVNESAETVDVSTSTLSAEVDENSIRELPLPHYGDSNAKILVFQVN